MNIGATNPRAAAEFGTGGSVERRAARPGPDPYLRWREFAVGHARPRGRDAPAVPGAWSAPLTGLWRRGA